MEVSPFLRKFVDSLDLNEVETYIELQFFLEKDTLHQYEPAMRLGDSATYGL